MSTVWSSPLLEFTARPRFSDPAERLMSEHPHWAPAPYAGDNNHRRWEWLDENGINHMIGCGSGGHSHDDAFEDFRKLGQRVKRCEGGACQHMTQPPRAVGLTPEEEAALSQQEAQAPQRYGVGEQVQYKGEPHTVQGYEPEMGLYELYHSQTGAPDSAEHEQLTPMQQPVAQPQYPPLQAVARGRGLWSPFWQEGGSPVPWAQGNHGKFSITPEGQFHHWSTDEYGVPHHRQVENHLGINSVITGEVDPNGTYWTTAKNPNADYDTLMNQAASQAQQAGMQPPSSGWLGNTRKTLLNRQATTFGTNVLSEVNGIANDRTTVTRFSAQGNRVRVVEIAGVDVQELGHSPIIAAAVMPWDDRELCILLEVPRHTAHVIHDWAKQQPWPEGTKLHQPSDYHCTLLYAPGAYGQKDSWWVDHLDQVPVSVKGIDTFGPDEDGYAYVLELESPELERHGQMLSNRAQAFGVELTHPDYKPHITVAYGPTSGLTGVDVPDFEFDIGPSKVSEPRRPQTVAQRVSYNPDCLNLSEPITLTHIAAILHDGFNTPENVAPHAQRLLQAAGYPTDEMTTLAAVQTWTLLYPDDLLAAEKIAQGNKDLSQPKGYTQWNQTFSLKKNGGDEKSLPLIGSSLVAFSPFLMKIVSTNSWIYTKQSMAADPDWWNSFTSANPYLYHQTDQSLLPSIANNGLLPWEHPDNPESSIYEGTPAEARPEHTYLATDPKNTGVKYHPNPVTLRVNAQQLNPSNISTDEDSLLGSRWLSQSPFEEYATMGQWANDKAVEPEQTQWGIEQGRYPGRMAHHGPIPPTAIEMQTSEGEWAPATQYKTATKLPNTRERSTIPQEVDDPEDNWDGEPPPDNPHHEIQVSNEWVYTN